MYMAQAAAYEAQVRSLFEEQRGAVQRHNETEDAIYDIGIQAALAKQRATEAEAAAKMEAIEVDKQLAALECDRAKLLKQKAQVKGVNG